MTNEQIADHFVLLAKLMEVHGDNSFKIKSYSILAYNIEKLPKAVADMSKEELFAQKGIGDSSGNKILELLHTGKLKQLNELLDKTPEGILNIMQIKGLGPKKVALLWNELGIESLGELEYACQENRLVTIKGFGEKTQSAILQNIAFINSSKGYFLWAQAHILAQYLSDTFRQQFPNAQIASAGAYKRQEDTLNSIDFVTTLASDAIGNFAIEPGAAKWNRLHATHYQLQIEAQPLCNFYCCEESAFQNTVFERTASESFLQAFKSQYVLPNQADSQKAIFIKNNLAYLEPALLNTPAFLQKAKEHKVPLLIQPGDIKGIIHTHSTWSDGAESIKAMAEAAKAKGMEYLVISDHSRSAFYANGLTEERIALQHAEIDALNMELAPFKIFKSIESDILYDGSLDYDNSILQTFDLVIASVHSNLKMSEEKAMERLLKAIENPYTTILGHPTGRLLLSREGYPVDHLKIIDACIANNVVIEINAHPRRLDMDWYWVEKGLDKGALFSIDPDAHSLSGIDDVFYGVISAQKSGLTKDRNLSSYSLADFIFYLENIRKFQQV